jgi:Pyridine nucleotide-disulphide oxidoreductase
MTADQPSAVSPQDTAVESCDVCIVGAGLAGMNALFVASRYLSHDQKVILVDSRERVGGMWADTYPYVRLHQPHGMFTAGNIKWTLGRDRAYLATKNEVLGHFGHCLDVIKERVRVDELFGWTMESHDEIAGAVQVACRSSDGRRRVIETKRLIKAYGFGITPNDPLEMSSKRLQSVSPDSCDMRGDDMRTSDAPVWIIGGGKTAMDTAHALITEYPGREVNLVAGSGTFFNCRDRFFPTGARRWWGGKLVSSLGMDMAHRFDGTNEADLWNWHSETYGTWVTPETGNFLLGNLSEAETTTISAGLNDVVMDHFVDAVDRNGSTEVVLRSGATRSIEPGSWIVNCTGYLLQHEHPYEPYVSSSGSVVSVQLRSATMHLTSFAAYFMAHLLFLGKLRELPLYELDGHDMRRKSAQALPYTLITMAQYNLSLITDSVPTKVILECGLDFDRWYPLPRRLPAIARYMLTHRRNRERQRRALDTVRERFDVRCGPLNLGSRVGGEPIQQQI